MKQKQFLGVALGLIVLIVVITFLFQCFVVKNTPSQVTTGTKSVPSPQTETQKVIPPAPLPDSVDGISSSIQAESDLDLSALDEEESGVLDEVNKDSDSVTNLGTSYDEQSL